MKLENEQSSLFSLFGYYLQLLLFFFTTLNRIILLDLTLNWFPWMPTLLNSLLILFFIVFVLQEKPPRSCKFWIKNLWSILRKVSQGINVVFQICELRGKKEEILCSFLKGVKLLLMVLLWVVAHLCDSGLWVAMSELNCVVSNWLKRNLWLLLVHNKRYCLKTWIFLKTPKTSALRRVRDYQQHKAVVLTLVVCLLVEHWSISDVDTCFQG